MSESTPPPEPPPNIDLRRGFRRAGTTLFWMSAGVVTALWAAQKAEIIKLGNWSGIVAFVILLIGFTASSAARMVGLTLEAISRSDMATDGAARIATTVAKVGWLPRLFLALLPGANLLTVADMLASVRDGSFAEGMRNTFQIFGAVIGGGLIGIGGAATTWQWLQGTALSALQPWLLVAAIGIGLMIGFFVAAGWVAKGFKPPPQLPG